MRCENHYSFQVILFLLLVLILDSAALAVSSSCPSYCGVIEIPYPFGVGKGCYLDKGYEIKCNNVSVNSVPFLSVNNKEVVNISLPIQYSDRSMSYASARIKIPITPSNEQEFSSLLNSTRLGYPKWFQAKQYATIELEWSFRTMNLSFITSLGCQNRLQYTRRSGNISCTCESRNNYGIIYASCRCTKGYRGNPYVFSGCKRIEEFHYDYGYSKRHIIPFGTLLVLELVLIPFGVALVSGVIYIFIRRLRQITRKKKFFKRNGGLLLQQQLTSTQGRVESTKVFSSNELAKATENFSENRVLGQGGQGTVFKGMLIDGRIMAVKKSKAVDEDKLEEFINEVVILSQINHRNIVKLLGCCLETEVPLLVYEFVSNGNLFEHLHDELSDYTVATWGVRLRIAIEIAGALSYLHSAASAPVYHRDIKSTNILDEKYRAKVSDFDTSRSVTEEHTHLTTLVSGTAGYLDPEYFQSSQFTDKSDVYSFGVVLVELITGEKPISFIRSLENRTLAAYFNLSMKENKVADIIDTRIRDNCKVEQVMAVAQVAERCLNPERNKRPSMREVSMELEKIRSSPQEMQAHVYVSENAKEKEAVEVNNISVESKNTVSATAPVSQYNIASLSSTWSDVEPLFPLQTQ